MDADSVSTLVQAERDFQKARNRAFWAEIWAKLRGHSMELLNFEEVRQKLQLRDDRYIGLQDVPLNQIVGSVGRYKDFTREFLPKRSIDKDRWKRIDAMTMGLTGLPPIEVYKVGDAYFVVDGNHRVSVARAAGMTTIQAYVTEYKTDVPLTAETTPDSLFIKEGYARFLKETSLKTLRPESDVTLTEPGHYKDVLQHIHVHHYFMGLNCQCPVTFREAVESWYDNVYTPMIEAITKHQILADFPGRTPADLYVWLLKHQGYMRERYGGEPMSPDETIGDFLNKLNR